MKVLYIDCGMGAAGDMLTSALLELLPNPDEFIFELNQLGIPGVQFIKNTVVSCGIKGTQISVKVNGEEENLCQHHHDRGPHEVNEHKHGHGHGHGYGHEHEHNHNHGHNHVHTNAYEHHHNGMHEIQHIVSALPVDKKVKEDVLAVYNIIAAAESKVHGVPVSEIHFHEVGTLDAIADITAVCMLVNRLSPDEIVVSPVHVGSGLVKCAHGILPVPAPATAYILKDVPIYGGSIKGELCTPTGAALLKHYATRFGDMPVMRTTAIGYGIGKKDFGTANCLRVMLGETENKTDTVSELSCNVDDMTAEEIGFAIDRLFEGGALEVYTVPAGMKKNRPGTLVNVLCTDENKEKIISLLFKHTTTIGVRESIMRRYVLNRRFETISTPYGEVRRKTSEGYGTTRFKYEYDDIARIAREKNISLTEARKLIEGC
ncbi:MAG: nickel pincer cofactor biosynthesis protein LarC [Clostridiaceae bacterium]|nr:nickel pincer cofactor biosynthesis protein LarC [Clostridiaceae bacterium]